MALVDDFLKYHEDDNNYKANEKNFDKMYEILNQYGDEDEDVDVVFQRAPREDQERMIELIKPITASKYMRLNTARELYYNALNGEYSKDYNRGVIDAIETLFDDGWLNEQEFRTDL